MLSVNKIEVLSIIVDYNSHEVRHYLKVNDKQDFTLESNKYNGIGVYTDGFMIKPEYIDCGQASKDVDMYRLSDDMYIALIQANSMAKKEFVEYFK